MNSLKDLELLPRIVCINNLLSVGFVLELWSCSNIELVRSCFSHPMCVKTWPHRGFNSPDQLLFYDG